MTKAEKLTSTPMVTKDAAALSCLGRATFHAHTVARRGGGSAGTLIPSQFDGRFRGDLWQGRAWACAADRSRQARELDRVRAMTSR